MRTKFDRLREVFQGAVEQHPASQWETYLDEACAGDAELRQQAALLLKAHAEGGSLVNAAPTDKDRTRLYQPITERPGTVIGPYKLLEQIGEGGFGVVFMAEQTEPIRRKVALKILKPGMDTRQVVARFEAERQALALMDHPNIAKVLDAGTIADCRLQIADWKSEISNLQSEIGAGRPYFVMELVKGVPITEYCDQTQLVPQERLELFVHVCQAVQHAHQKGIIHRDLKPTNVMVTVQDGAALVKVIDFGIAKALGQQLTDKTLFTGYAQLIGTPLYMSPEQAALSNVDVDTRSDIYSLGVLLYELLTGTTPFGKDRFQEAGYDEIRRIIREEEPPKPSTRLSETWTAARRAPSAPNGAAPGKGASPTTLRALRFYELDWVVMKALEKDRNRRYESASAFAADVQHYLHDEPVLACPPSTWYRFRKLARRNSRALVMVSVFALAALVGVGALAVSTVLVWKANKELKEAVDRERLAVDRERREVSFQRITVAHRELSTDNPAAALRALKDCPEDLRGWEWHYLMRLLKVDPLVIRDKTEVLGVAFSPDGQRLASAGGDGAVRIWNGRTGKLIQEFKAHDKAVCCVVFHADGRHVASAGADRLVKVWDLATGQAVFQGPCDAIRKFGVAYTVAFRPPEGRHLAAGCDEKVRVWDWEKRQLLHTFDGPEHHSIPVAFSRDGRRLATGAFPDGLKILDPEQGLVLCTLPRQRYPISALAFSTDGARLAEASLGRFVNVWDTTTGAQLHLPQDGNVLCVAFSPDGRRLASAGEDKTVHLLDSATGREVLGLRGHNDMCNCVTFSPDGGRLASASSDGTICIWDATPLRGDEGEASQTFTDDGEVRCVAVSPDAQWIASAGNEKLVRIRDAATGRVIFDFTGHSLLVFSVAWHPDGRLIATAGSDGRQQAVKVWNAFDGQVQFSIPVGRDSSAGPYQVVAFSPDRRHLLTGKIGGAVEVWDAKSGHKLATLDTRDREIRALVFSRDGRRLASASGDGKVKLWDASRLDQKQEARLTLQARVPGPSVNVAFSPDSQRLAAGGEGNTVKIWDLEKGEEPEMILTGHGKEVYAVAFSPNDEAPWIASGGEDGKVNVWHCRTGELVRSFRGHTSLVSSLVFSPDGQRLYSGSRDATVKVWDLTQLSQVPER